MSMTTPTSTETTSDPASSDLAPHAFARRHFLSIDQLNEASARDLMNASSAFADAIRAEDDIPHHLANARVMTVFFENSTRTLASFEMAVKRLGGEVISLPIAASSTKKGESLADTLKTLDAMRPDMVVMRHGAPGAADLAARLMDASVINAGDGARGHPTQALLDAVTLQRTFGDVAGLRVTICGDIRHSRVARSNVALLSLLGAQVRLCAPGPLLPDAVHDWGVPVSHSFAEGLPGSDVVMMLRVQTERMAGHFVPSVREYHRFFGLDLKTLMEHAPAAKVMHPGPMNRGVEITGSLADHLTKSLILDQVELGVATRMAVLSKLMANRVGGAA